MKKAFLLAAAAAIVLFPQPGKAHRADDKILLKDLRAAGDIFTVKDNMTMNLKAVVTGPDINIEKINNKNEEREYKEEVLAATAQGPTSALRFYITARDAEDGEGGPKKTTRSYEGKSVRLTRTGKTATATSSVTLKPEDVHELSEGFKNDDMSVFSDKPIGIGDSWTVPLSKLLGTSEDLPDGKATGTYTDIVQQGGHRCAHIHITANISQDLGGIVLSGELQGDTYFALDIHRTILLKLSGPLKMVGKQTAGGKTIEITGSGKIDAGISFTYAKVAGKAQPTAPK